MQVAARFNPFFYMIDGLRYSMISYSESNIVWGAIGLTLATLILFGVVVYLFKIGYKLRT
jgi:ABC-2 type transport system permease protein